MAVAHLEEPAPWTFPKPETGVNQENLTAGPLTSNEFEATDQEIELIVKDVLENSSSFSLQERLISIFDDG